MAVELLDPSACLLKLQFSNYSEDEIKKLSQIKIEEWISFDTLQNATAKGLADPNLGAYENGKRCQKCGLLFNDTRGSFCPGHFGHVELILPVFNPVTFDVLLKWLKISCLQCHHLLRHKSQVSLFLKQMEALDYGLVTTVGELGFIYYEMLEEGKEAADKAIDNELIGRLDDCLKSAIKDLKNGSLPDADNHTRLVLACRQKLCDDFFKKKFTMCPHCHHGKIPVRSESSAKIYWGRPNKAQREFRKQQQLLKKKQKVKEHTESVEMDEESCDNSKGGEQLMLPTEAKYMLQSIWQKNDKVFRRLFGSFMCEEPLTLKTAYPTDTFFVNSLLVSPIRMRPPARMKGSIIENPLTMNLKHVVMENRQLKSLLLKWKMENLTSEVVSQIIVSNVEKNVDDLSLAKEVLDSWHKLQLRVNACYDNRLGKMFKDATRGIKQVLERKAGTMRMHMMGKRVNCAARSVISPDPYLDTHEIGLSKTFAKRLQFPEYVNEKNVVELQQMVINGPNVYPGAENVEFEDGTIKTLSLMTDAQRLGLAKQLLTPSVGSSFISNKKVHRHVKDGDILILNRQPTLHRPSMQAFKAKVLPSENTLRINYSACKAFNADFDGDEMNAHLPQDYRSQTEGAVFVATEHQYLVPKDGCPISGLIQDHMIGGVMLTIRGQFFIKEDYHKLVYAGLKDFKGRIKFLRPSILRPSCLWSGKQVVSTILLNLIPIGKKPLTVVGSAKVRNTDWINVNKSMSRSKSDEDKYEFLSESYVIIRDSLLLVGVLDKNAFGATTYGLVHCYFELYGAEVASALLSCLARLFIMFLHNHSSFTMDIGDVLVTKEGQRRWKEERKKCRGSNMETFRLALNLPGADVKEIHNYIEASHFSTDPSDLATIGNDIKLQLSSFQDDIKKACWPDNLWKRFPKNGLQLMVTSGAKGSLVNCTQMVCLLGQVDLESGRPPMQISGQTLPGVPPYAASAHCGGFIDHRFLSGINLLDYFFHHMAGREGLVDTAVKTSRSGYLQRCLVKHLEGLKVAYDLTVRDADGTIIQFLYGEDGLDVTRAPFLKEHLFPFIVANKSTLKSKHFKQSDTTSIYEYNERLKMWKQKFGSCDGKGVLISPFLVFCKKRWTKVMAAVQSELRGNDQLQREIDAGAVNKALILEKKCKQNLIEEWRLLSEKKHHRFIRKSRPCPDPITDQFFPMSTFGSISEKMQAAVDRFISSEKNEKLFRKTFVNGKPVSKAISEKKFQNLIYEKYQSSLAVPGESVGILAATSIGEQTTQMTLNTFHFAGHGAMNVTLGIPRLREILMTAGSSIKTPITMVPLLDVGEVTETKIKKVVHQFQKVCLEELVEAFDVQFRYNQDGGLCYKVCMVLVKADKCLAEYGLKHKVILQHFEQKFSVRLRLTLLRFVNTFKTNDLIQNETVRQQFRQRGAGAEDNTDDTDDKRRYEAIADDESNDDSDDEQTEQRDFQNEGEKDEDDDENSTDDDEDGPFHGQKIAEKDNSQVAEYEKIKEKEKKPEDSDKDEQGMAEEETMVDMDVDDKSSEKESENYFGRTVFIKNMKPFALEYSRSTDERSLNFILQIKTESRLESDLSTIILRLLKQSFVTAVQGNFKSCIAKEIEEGDSPSWMFQGNAKRTASKKRQKLQFQGVDFQKIYSMQDMVDVNEVYTNDIRAMAKTYGAEAARVVLIDEIRSVFRAYQIEVDYRHLSLIADYMMSSGSFEPISKRGMESNPFALHKATFECATTFLRKALSEGVPDNIEPPSSRLVVGRPISCGTGSFEVTVPVDFR